MDKAWIEGRYKGRIKNGQKAGKAASRAEKEWNTGRIRGGYKLDRGQMGSINDVKSGKGGGFEVDKNRRKTEKKIRRMDKGGKGGGAQGLKQRG